MAGSVAVWEYSDSRQRRLWRCRRSTADLSLHHLSHSPAEAPVGRCLRSGPAAKGATSQPGRPGAFPIARAGRFASSHASPGRVMEESARRSRNRAFWIVRLATLGSVGGALGLTWGFATLAEAYFSGKPPAPPTPPQVPVLAAPVQGSRPVITTIVHHPGAAPVPAPGRSAAPQPPAQPPAAAPQPPPAPVCHSTPSKPC